jgi:hypothetical protein
MIFLLHHGEKRLHLFLVQEGQVMRGSVLWLIGLSCLYPAPKPAEIHFGRDILSILSENCLRCHGPDEKARKAKLRLDTHEGALRVIVPGKSADSELIRRINAADDEVMPPPQTRRKLSASQKELLRRWIDQGASWGKHWAYETPHQPPLPAVKNPIWCRNPLDRFILARLEAEGLTPSPAAARETLIRRVSLDLTGLPPTLKEVDAFVADSAPDAYEKVVDRLLASERYGERMAMDWLDAARYADTNGYQNDFARTMWPWRDGVIAAFNRNQPFDRFLTEQLAGDLLAGATLQQKIASGFNRNNRTVTEAGSIDEEWRVENVVDRVETTATVFLGLTMGCARCHDHKYDPISQKDFYRFYAFFNNVNELGVYTEQRGNVAPLVQVPSPGDEERLKQLDAGIARAQEDLRKQEAALPAAQKKWEEEQRTRPAPPSPSGPSGLEVWIPLTETLNVFPGDAPSAIAPGKTAMKLAWVDGPAGSPALKFTGEANGFVDAGQAIRLERTDHFSDGGWVKPEGDGAVLSKMDDDAAYRGFDLLVVKDRVEVHLVNTWPTSAIKVSTREALPRDTWSHVFVTYDGSSKARGVTIYLNGRRAPVDVNNDNLSGSLATGQPLRLGKRSTAFTLRGALADIRFYRRTLAAAEVRLVIENALTPLLARAPGQRTAQQQETLGEWHCLP